MSTVKSNLAEVLITQGYQDLSGQIIRGVMTLIQELESALAELQRIVGPGSVAGISAESVAANEVVDVSAGFGPHVPGIERRSAVNDQSDVDALMSQMGV
jgi:chemotaxis protein CheZ